MISDVTTRRRFIRPGAAYGLALLAAGAALAVPAGVISGSAPPSTPPTPPPSTSSSSSSSTSSTTTTTTLPPIAPEVWARFDEIIGSALGGNRASSVALSLDGQVVHAAAFGTRTGDAADPASVLDRFRIASISKVITATVVLQLVERGDLALDEPIGFRLAAIAGVEPGDPSMAAVTLRQVLSHTSGIPKYREEFFGDRFHSCEEAAAFGMARSLDGTPGTAHVYSNLNYCLLSLLIADVTGLSYEAAATEILLTPLGITGMRLVRTIDPNADEVVHESGADRTYMESLAGAGAWVATASDMVRILDSLDPMNPGWHPLSSAMATAMRQPIPDVRFPEPNERRYGLGIVVWPDGSAGHTGTLENTHTMLVQRSDGITWCILVSGDYPESTESLREIFDRALSGAGIG